ncbi:helix-turn-helix domain-containing protein [Paraoerskovia marina]|uniref:helix-turn-helix domain-containing protein n=1 Tax=Paraoerskovia marina TaxID=545619 RepID=UPI000492BBBC|nr:helix-turn-helix domain-containing protein [Paraoerskovia marina]
MFVLTIDQRGSTHASDEVPALLDALTETSPTALLLPYERTVGDEVQGLLVDAATVVETVLRIAGRGGWSVGLGIGSVREPLPGSTREATGDAYVRARDAVDRAKGRGLTVPLAVTGADEERAHDTEAFLRLLAAVVARRSTAGHDAVAALRRVGGTQKEAAAELGISEQAMSQRLRAALHDEVEAARPVAVRMLQEADG